MTKRKTLFDRTLSVATAPNGTVFTTEWMDVSDCNELYGWLLVNEITATPGAVSVDCVVEREAFHTAGVVTLLTFTQVLVASAPGTEEKTEVTKIGGRVRGKITVGGTLGTNKTMRVQLIVGAKAA